MYVKKSVDSFLLLLNNTFLRSSKFTIFLSKLEDKNIPKVEFKIILKVRNNNVIIRIKACYKNIIGIKKFAINDFAFLTVVFIFFGLYNRANNGIKCHEYIYFIALFKILFSKILHNCLILHF